LIISKTAYGYGVYTLVCKLPNFRGSWPAFWLIDIDDLPPEVDVFEHFRKDCFLTRFHVTTSYNGGPTYQDNKNISKAIYRLYPYDWGWTAFGLIWLPGSMTFMVNNRTSLIIKPGQFPKYPAGKMNIILGSGIGNWKPQVNKFKPFVVKSLTFEPYLKVN
jgi:beta-glucanase (GH16 family)